MARARSAACGSPRRQRLMSGRRASVGKTITDLKAKHDPKTVIGNLAAELEKAKATELTTTMVREFLGTAKLETEKLNIPKWVYEPSVTAAAPGVPNLLLSDFHWGERVFKAQVNGVNEFNLAIAARRLKHVIDKVPYLTKILDPQMRY